MTLSPLISRVKAATGPDREIDLAVERVVSGHGWRWLDRGETVTYDRFSENAYGNPICSLEGYTASIDAVVALAERTLGVRDALSAVVTAFNNHRWGETFEQPMSKVLPRMALAEVLRALEAKQQEKES